MNLRTAFLLLLITLALVFPAQSRADSDGYFCTSKGYLAYELREGLTPGAVGHVLKVVRFDTDRGIYFAGQVTLQDFQPHGLTCSPNRIEIFGWAKVFTKYAIETTEPENVRIVETTEEPARQFDYHTEGPEPANLGRWSTPGRIPLVSQDSGHRYELVLTRWSKQTEDGVESHCKAEIVRVDSQGAEVQRLTLVELQNIDSTD
jgi:hypothetical protein